MISTTPRTGLEPELALRSVLAHLLTMPLPAVSRVHVLLFPFILLPFVARQPVFALRVEALGICVIALLVIFLDHSIQDGIEVLIGVDELVVGTLK
jgi:hypothetical protein